VPPLLSFAPTISISDESISNTAATALLKPFSASSEEAKAAAVTPFTSWMKRIFTTELKDGAKVGLAVGTRVGTGEGANVGKREEVAVGATDGALLGAWVGTNVGAVDGLALGMEVGATDGAPLGACVGTTVGTGSRSIAKCHGNNSFSFMA
jgi:hypothetical protein